MHAVQSPDSINREINIQDPPCAVHENFIKLFIFYLTVVSPKFTALMVYSSSLLPTPFNILKRHLPLFSPPVCFHTIISLLPVELLHPDTLMVELMQ